MVVLRLCYRLMMIAKITLLLLPFGLIAFDECTNWCKDGESWLIKFKTLEADIHPAESPNRLVRRAAAKNEIDFSASTTKTICRTRECLKIDKNMMEKVDQTLNPCDDFYQFACGKLNFNFNTERGGKEGRVLVSPNIITSRLHDILEEPDSLEDDTALKLAKGMFRTCMDNTETQSELKNMISSVGGWSLQRNWSEKNFTLDEFYEKSVDLGYIPSSLFTIDIIQHPDNTDKKIIVIMNPSTETFHGWPLQMKSYVDISDFTPSLLNGIASKLGLSEAAIILNYQSTREKAREIADSYDASPEPTIMKLSRLKKKSKGIPWRGILRGVFKPMTITLELEIMVECEKCLKNLAKSFVTKDKKSLADYLIWNLIADNLMDSNYRMVVARMWRSARRTSKENFCTLRVTSLFRKVMNYEYSNRYLNRKLMSDLKKFIEQLKASFQSVLRESKYLDSKTRRKALEKLSSMKFYTPYDREINDKDEITRYHAGMEIDLESFFHSLMKVRKHIIKRTVNSFNEQIPLEVHHQRLWKNSHYDASLNSVFLSVDSLEELMFSKNRPDYLNFGALGSLIGHEIAHGFSLKGRLFDKNGNQRNWWGSKSKHEQDQRVRCFADEYMKYADKATVEVIKAEIIADNDGARIAYNSYVNSSKLTEKDEELPSFAGWSSRQMFWMSYATVLCTEVPKSKRSRHATPPIRINGLVSSSEEFSRDFQCGPGDKMGSSKKCNLWL